MAKSKIEKIEKNPLSQALGAYFRKERDLMRKTSNEIAKKINIGASFYRMIEAGSANIHPSRVLNIINTFPNCGIELNSLCKYLVAIQMIEPSLTSHNELKQAIDSLSEADGEFERLFKAFESVLKYIKDKNTEKVKEYIDDENLNNELREFLTSKFYELEPEKRLDQKLNELIDDTPSFYLDFALNTLQSLHQLPLSIITSDLWHWEEKNKDNIVSRYCISKNHDYVTSKKNLQRYHYTHLWSSDFKTENFIFIEDDKSSKDLKHLFDKNLKNSLKDSNFISRLSDADTYLKKVNIKTCSSQRTDILEILGSNDEMQYDAIWIYIMKNNNRIGILAEIDKENLKLIKGTSLKFKETIDKLDSLIEIWNEID